VTRHGRTARTSTSAGEPALLGEPPPPSSSIAVAERADAPPLPARAGGSRAPGGKDPRRDRAMRCCVDPDAGGSGRLGRVDASVRHSPAGSPHWRVAGGSDARPGLLHQLYRGERGLGAVDRGRAGPGRLIDGGAGVRLPAGFGFRARDAASDRVGGPASLQAPAGEGLTAGHPVAKGKSFGWVLTFGVRGASPV